MSAISSSMRSGRTRKFKAEINVVPYIDVMLVLLIIFMAAAPMSDPSVVNLPSAGKSVAPPSAYVHLVLKPDQEATLAVQQAGRNVNKPVQMSGRVEMIKQLVALHKSQPDLPLMISADKSIQYDEVMQALASARKSGITRVGLATR